MSTKNNPHLLVSINAFGAVRSTLYSSRRTATRGAFRASQDNDGWEHFVIQDCGDHWGLWAGFGAGRELGVADLQGRASYVGTALNEEFGNV